MVQRVFTGPEFPGHGSVDHGNRLDAGEFLELVTLTHAELLAAFERGEVTDAKTVAALFWLERRRARR